MALNVGELTATLTLDSSNFVAGLKAAQTQMVGASAAFDVDFRPALQRAVDGAAAIMPSAGAAVASAFASGITSSAGAAFIAGGGVMQAALNGASALSNSGVKIGAQFAQGIASGISANSGVIRAAATLAANAAAAAAKAALGIASPSKVGQYIGRMFDQGIVSGINSGGAAVASAARGLVNGLKTSVTVGNFGDTASAEMDYQRLADAIGTRVADELNARPAYFEINDMTFAAASLDANKRVLSARERKLALGYGRG